MTPEVIQIPLLVHLPATSARRTADPEAISFSTDITPTIYAALGYQPAAANAFMGSPLVGADPEVARERRRGSFVLAASYGAVYAVVRRNGHRLYIADAVNGGDHAYERGADGHWTEGAMTDGIRMVNQLQIRRSHRRARRALPPPMTPSAYALLGLTAIVGALAAALMFAVLRFVAAARDTRRHTRGDGGDTAILSAALQEAVEKLKAQERATAARAEASERLSEEIIASLTAGLLVVGLEGEVRILNPAGRRMLERAGGGSSRGLPGLPSSAERAGAVRADRRLFRATRDHCQTHHAAPRGAARRLPHRRHRVAAVRSPPRAARGHLPVHRPDRGEGP